MHSGYVSFDWMAMKLPGIQIQMVAMTSSKLGMTF